MKKTVLLGLVLCVTCAASFAVASPVQDGGGASVYYRDGARFALEGRLAEAASAFEQAAALDPTNGNAYYALGNVYSELGRWADAVNAYYKAISLNREDVEAYNALGVALGMRGQYEQSAAAFERAIKIYPKWAEPYFHLSEARRRLHDEEAAQAAYKKALRLRPDYATNPPRTFGSARAQTAAVQPRGQILDAMRTFNLGGAQPERVGAPASSTPTEAAHPAGVAAGDGARAKPAATPNTSAANARGVTRNEPTDARGYYDLGVREERAGRHEEAIAALRQSVLMDRSSAAAYLALGDSYAALGRWRESVDAYEQAARLRPDDAETYRRLGRAYAKLREATPETKMGRTEPNTGDDGTGAASHASSSSNAAAGVKSAAGNNVGEREAASAARAAEAEAGGVASGSEVAAGVGDPDPTAIYRVGPGDVLDIRVLDGRARRATSYEVTPTGLLAYAGLAEPLKVAGLTTDEVASLLGARLHLRPGGPNPEVAVGVSQYASHAIIVSGLVKEAGTKFLQREGVPLYVVVAYAQPLPTAAQAVVNSRATGRTTVVDLSDTSAMKMLVRPGDVINVRARTNEARR